jgi:hypothetical protein
MFSLLDGRFLILQQLETGFFLSPVSRFYKQGTKLDSVELSSACVWPHVGVTYERSRLTLLSSSIVTCIPIAKQRFGKQASTLDCFCGVCPATVAMQWFGKHALTIETVFCVVRAEGLF